MLFQLKTRIPIFINTFFLLIFSIHASIIGFWIIYPENPSTKVYTKDVKDLDAFPLSFKICVRELTNPQYRYTKIGYDNIWSFFKGTINGTSVGWASQTGKMSRQRTVKGAQKSYKCYFTFDRGKNNRV